MATKSTKTNSAKSSKTSPSIDEIAKTTAKKTKAKTSINPEEIIRDLENKQKTKDLPEIKAGWTVAVHQLVAEKGGKTRTQIFEGIVIKYVREKQLGAMLTIRKVASGVGVERTFFLHSPLIEKVEVKKRAKARRARVYFMRKLSGKAAVRKEIAPKSEPKTKSTSSTSAAKAS